MGGTGNISVLEVILIGMVAMFLFALAVILFFIIYQRRLLAQQKKYQEATSNYQRELLKATITSQENERNRVAKDLHDDVGALLTTTKLYLNQITAETTTEELIQTTEKMRTLFDLMIDSVRSISKDLRPVVLQNLGLADAVESLAQRINAAGSIRVVFKNQLSLDLEKEQELNVYRVIQELINNTIKHAKASRITLQFKNTAGHLILYYTDNGIGLDLKSLKKNKGLGIKNIESRLSLLNGTIKFDEAQNGLAIEIRVPIK